jgi:hypothetical protein
MLRTASSPRFRIFRCSWTVVRKGETVEFHWTFTGTNTGPGGSGKWVRISGFEEWTFGDDGLVAESKGHYDEAEYERQLAHGSAE